MGVGPKAEPEGVSERRIAALDRRPGLAVVRRRRPPLFLGAIHQLLVVVFAVAAAAAVVATHFCWWLPALVLLRATALLVNFVCVCVCVRYAAFRWRGAIDRMAVIVTAADAADAGAAEVR